MLVLLLKTFPVFSTGLVIWIITRSWGPLPARRLYSRHSHTDINLESSDHGADMSVEYVSKTRVQSAQTKTTKGWPQLRKGQGYIVNTFCMQGNGAIQTHGCSQNYWTASQNAWYLVPQRIPALNHHGRRPAVNPSQHAQDLHHLI